MKRSVIVASALAFMLGFVVAIPVVFQGFDRLAQQVDTVLAVSFYAMVAVLLIALLIAAFRDRILNALFKTVNASLDSLVQPLGNTILHIVNLDQDRAFEQGIELVRRLVAYYVWFTTRNWSLALILGLAGAFVGLLGSSLLLRQNQLLLEQNTKLDSQNNLIQTQNVMLEMQTKIARQQIEPKFMITVSHLAEAGEQRNSQDELVVFNSGAVVSELDFDTAVFAEVELYYRQPNHGKSLQKTIAINGYYGANLLSAAGQGKLVSMVGNRNYERVLDVTGAFAELADKNGMFGGFRLLRILRVSYRGQLGDSSVKYFLVDSIRGGYEISESEGEKWFQEWDKGFVERTILEFDTLTAENLFKAATAQ